MELNKTDWIQLEREIEKYERKYGKRLYHYTSLNTFFSMIRSKEIWLTNTGTMNDRKEISYYVERLENELSEYDNDGFFEKVYEQIPLSYKYAFCLSTENDDAAQWERYGNSAEGVCISFSVAELCKCLYGYNDFMFNEVFYNESVTDDKYYEIIKKYLETQEIDIYSSEEELIRRVIHVGNLHKHKSFKNEHEVRITTMDNKNQHGVRYELKEIGSVVKKVLILNPDIMGKDKGTYFEKLIEQVVIGPRSQQNVSVLKQYILSNGLNDLANRVIESDCPLR